MEFGRNDVGRLFQRQLCPYSPHVQRDDRTTHPPELSHGATFAIQS
jgi:hypothetical protein